MGGSGTPQRKRANAATGALNSAYALWELLFPATCACCGVGGTALLRRGDALKQPQKAGVVPQRSGLCTDCSSRVQERLAQPYQPLVQYRLPPVLTAGSYEAEVTRTILAFKNAGRLGRTVGGRSGGAPLGCLSYRADSSRGYTVLGSCPVVACERASPRLFSGAGVSG